MKCLSVRQPWAELIVSGKKQLEIRSWKTSYRGPLLIHAAGCKVDRADCERLGISQDSSRGVIIGAVDLMAIFHSASEDGWRKMRELHFCAGKRPYGAGTLIWCLAHPCRFEVPISFKGQLGVFNVPDELVREQLRRLKRR